MRTKGYWPVCAREQQQRENLSSAGERNLVLLSDVAPLNAPLPA